MHYTCVTTGVLTELEWLGPGCKALAIDVPTVVSASTSRFCFAGRFAGLAENIGTSGSAALSAVPTS